MEITAADIAFERAENLRLGQSSGTGKSIHTRLWRELFQQSGRPRDPRQMPRYMDLLDAVAKNVTFYRLACNMDPEAMVGTDRD